MERTDSKFHLVHLAAKRAREINAYYAQLGEGMKNYVPPLVSIESSKPLTIALEEIASGKIEHAEPTEEQPQDPLAFIEAAEGEEEPADVEVDLEAIDGAEEISGEATAEASAEATGGEATDGAAEAGDEASAEPETEPDTAASDEADEA